MLRSFISTDKRFLQTAFCLFVTLVFAGCSEPVATFTPGKTSFKAGDTIRISNASKGAERFEWHLNGNQISADKDLKYALPPSAAGVHTLSLKVFDGDNSAVSTQTFVVTVPAGTVTAWSTFGGVEVMNVSGNETATIGTTSFGYKEDPGCNAGGCVTFTLAPGSYTVDGSSEVTRTRRVLQVLADNCVSVKMH